ncbi:MAG: hypothetical protein ACI9IA_002546 [Enterobacterales bacterium]|jgi:hypothetical protein
MMYKTISILFISLMIINLAACSNMEPEAQLSKEEITIDEAAMEDKPLKLMTLTATVTYIDLEGGFYGLITDKGKKLLPINLEKEHQIDGTVLSFSSKRITTRFTTKQWGQLVELVDVKLITSAANNYL